jgi:hypothetical protein
LVLCGLAVGRDSGIDGDTKRAGWLLGHRWLSSMGHPPYHSCYPIIK